MSLIQVNNLREPELTERIANFIDMDAPILGVFQCVLTKYNNEWSMLMAVLRLGDTDPDRKHQACCYKYPNYQFICRPLQDVKLSELVASLENDGSLPIPNMPILGSKEGNINWTESLIPSHATDASFPMRRFSARVNHDVYCHDSKLVAHDMAFHPSAFGYVKEFLGLERFHGSSDSRKGELCIDILDLRGHITLSNKDVRFRCETMGTLSMVGAINGDPVNLKSPQDTYAFEPEKASDIELWLVNDRDEIIDYCSSSAWEYLYETQTNNTDLAKLLEIIEAGESEHCEFKTYIDLVNREKNKPWELDKAVCAFSNHQGGKLFIGVDNDTRIIGINEGCQRDYQCNPSEGAKLYQRALVKRLQESLKKNQCFSTNLIEHNELIILVVDVHKANGLNYLLQKKEAYIRRGASSPQMAPSEIQAFPIEQDALGRELF